jgi:nucleotide-binding universal stress UspA family protein
MKRKLLVAVDGSVYSSNMISYLCRLFHDQANIAFHLFNTIPFGQLPNGHELLSETDLISTLGLKGQKKFATADRNINKAMDKLVRGGIAPERISSDAHLSRAGIAADIIHEARRGLYDALVIGRRGLGRLEQFFIGSVSTTVLEKCYDVPVWIIDGQVDSRKFLVPVDGSEHTLRAVDHLAFIVKDVPKVEITLFHSKAILAQRSAIDFDQCSEQWGADWCQEHLTRKDSHFHGPQQLLIESGIPAARIRRKKTTMGIHPSRQIVRQALIDGLGTIVMGRRPEDANKGITGSVSGRVVAMAVNTSIWLVG